MSLSESDALDLFLRGRAILIAPRCVVYDQLVSEGK